MAGDRRFCTDISNDYDVIKRILKAVDSCGIRWRGGENPAGYGIGEGRRLATQYLAVSDGVIHGTGNYTNYEVVSSSEFINRCIGGAYA